MRSATIKRKTKETDIEVSVNLDGTGVSNVVTGIGFFDHMLDLLARHSRIDITGRPVLVFKVEFPRDKVGQFDTELVREWFNAFAINAGVTLHVETLYGENSHHIAESCFKGLARALRAAVAIDPRAAGEVPSTKGQLGG